MATEALKKLMKLYDIEHSGDLNKAEWINLCSHHTINLAPDLSSTLFDGLDTDNDGLVCINDILNELSIWEKNQMNTHQNESTEFELQPISFDKTNEKLTNTSRTTNRNLNNQFDRNTNLSVLERRKHARQFVPTSLNISPDSSEQWITKKELDQNGFEIITTTPVPNNSRYKSAYELENVLSTNYPELLSPFKTVLQDFRNELMANKYEQSNLEENYLREKAARREDMLRLENELESQIKRIEECTKFEVQQKLQQEYQTLVRNKEKEICEIRDQVEQLRNKIKHRASSKDQISSPYVISMDKKYSEMDIGPSTPVAYTNISTDDVDENKLRNILIILTQRETELKSLKEQLSKQEKQMMMDKREIINHEEEKQQLYNQLNTMQEVMQRLNQTNSYLCSALKQNRSFNSLLVPERPFSPSSSAASELMESQINGMKTRYGYAFDHTDQAHSLPPENDLVGFPPPYYGLSSTNAKENFQEHGLKRSDYSSENLSSASAYNLHKREMYDEPHPSSIQQPERIFKVIMVGDSGVGKSSFLYRFCDGVFYPQIRVTVGIDFRTKNVTVDNHIYTIQLWDTAGQEKFSRLIRSYFRKVDGIILMYAVSQPDTFANVKFWMETISESTDQTSVPILIVGNKIDLRQTDRQEPNNTITPEMGQRLAKLYQTLFIETSAKNTYNIGEAIELLSREMKLNEDKQVAGITLPSESLKKPVKAKCCL